MTSAVAIIPARYGSTRFPGKVLAPLLGRPMLHHVVEGVLASRHIRRVLVAVDDERVARAAREAGAEAVLTRPDHPSGTDRVAEAARGLEADVIVNVQGDEPLISASSVDRLAEALFDDDDLAMATLSQPLDSADELFDPNVVKVVTGRTGRALYFSRSPIPYLWSGSGPPAAELRSTFDVSALDRYQRHVGIYGYRRQALLALAATPPTPLESAERLEQLRALESGYAIRVLPAAHRSLGVDTPTDLARAETLLGRNAEGRE